MLLKILLPTLEFLAFFVAWVIALLAAGLVLLYIFLRLLVQSGVMN